MAQSTSADPSCGLCKDIHDWMNSAKASAFSQARSLFSNKSNNISDPYEPFPSPPDADQLGRETWTFLHTLAAFYPQKPSLDHQSKTKQFFTLLPSMYPCNVCSEHLKDELQINPPRVASNVDLSNWLCEVHNEVNGRLGKPVFDCSKALERWKLGVRKRLVEHQNSTSEDFKPHTKPDTTISSTGDSSSKHLFPNTSTSNIYSN